MDALAVLSICNWVMAELVRVFHNLSVVEAQKIVDALAEIRIPIIWSDDSTTKRVLQPALKLHEQLLLLIATSAPEVSVEKLMSWTEYGDKKYFMRTLRALHSKRFLEFNKATNVVQILPPGTKFVQDLMRKKQLSTVP
jgi:hypothetical protein